MPESTSTVISVCYDLFPEIFLSACVVTRDGLVENSAVTLMEPSSHSSREKGKWLLS